MDATPLLAGFRALIRDARGRAPGLKSSGIFPSFLSRSLDLDVVKGTIEPNYSPGSKDPKCPNLSATCQPLR